MFNIVALRFIAQEREELNKNNTALVESEVTRLYDEKLEQIKIKEFRANMDETVLSLEIKPSRNLQRKMMRFDIRLEEAVERMASLGCIEECEEQEELTMNPSVA